MTAESQFGPVRKFGRMDPNVYHELEDMAQWQSIVEALGDVCLDTGVEHEPSYAERDMARLTATFPGIADPVNTEALRTAPVVDLAPSRMQKARVVLVVMGAVWAGAGAAFLTAVGVWWWTR